MPVTKRTHDEPPYNGKPVFIIRSPEAKSRKIMGVTFIDGIAKMTDPVRAQWFDEAFPVTYKVVDEKVVVDSPGYQITVPTGYQKWTNAVHPDADDYADDDSDFESDIIPVSDEAWV